MSALQGNRIPVKITDIKRKISYSFIIKSKFTVVNGDSGIGKTVLLDLFRSIEVSPDIVLEGNCIPIELPRNIGRQSNICNYLREIVYSYKPYEIDPFGVLFYCDEEHQVFKDLEYQKQLSESEYNFLFVGRNPLVGVPYSVEDIYEVYSKYSAPKVHKLIPVYKEKPPAFLKYKLLKTEDHKSGFKFFSKFLKSVESSNGKGSIHDLIQVDSDTLYCVDGLGFGSEYVRVMENNIISKNNGLWVIPSFEFLLLSSDMFGDDILPIVNKHLRMIGKDPLSSIPEIADDFCVNKEHYYESQLSNIMSALSQHYSKENPGKCFLENCCDYINWHTHKYEGACPLYFEGDKFELILGKDLYAILCKAFGKKDLELFDSKLSDAEDAGASGTTSAFNA